MISSRPLYTRFPEILPNTTVMGKISIEEAVPREGAKRHTCRMDVKTQKMIVPHRSRIASKANPEVAPAKERPFRARKMPSRVAKRTPHIRPPGTHISAREGVRTISFPDPRQHSSGDCKNGVLCMSPVRFISLSRFFFRFPSLQVPLVLVP